MTASSIESTVDRGSFGPVGRSATEAKLPPWGDGARNGIILVRGVPRWLLSSSRLKEHRP